MCVALVASTNLCAQLKTRVQGVVYTLEHHVAMPRVSISVNDMSIATTDEDGKFSITVERDAVLSFYKEGYDLETFALRGEQEIEVRMKTKVVEIESVVVTVKALNNKVTAEPTDIEIKGNYFHLRTKFSIPAKMLKTDCRFVVQSSVYDVTQDKVMYMRPVAIDGRNYDIIEHRHKHFGQTEDKLESFIVENTITKQDQIYPYKDSIYIESNNLDNDFQADCFLAIVSYHEPAIFSDTVTIAKGTVNPLRFMQMQDVNGLAIDESKFVPAPEMELCNTKGSADIEFEVGKSTINYKITKNKTNIDLIREVIRSVQMDENSTLKAVSMVGYASPDGSYQVNQSLSSRRTEELLKIVTQDIDDELKKYITISSSGVVEKWSKVADLARADSLPVAAKLDEIIKKTGDDYVNTSYQFRRLAEYRKIISPKYLPMLRRVEYMVDYSVFRPLTIDEIREKYKVDGGHLSRFEYYKLITELTNQNEREFFEEASIKDFPNFTIAANRLALRLIASDSIDLELLKPCLAGIDVPDELRYNQAIMATRAREMEVADSLLNLITITPEMEFLYRAVGLIRGNYSENYDYFQERGGLNEVLVLLCMKRNDEAYDKMKEMMRDATNAMIPEYNYVYAICANRKEDLNTAMVYLQLAMELDPTLERIAKIDSDILDIYDLIKIE